LIFLAALTSYGQNHTVQTEGADFDRHRTASFYKILAEYQQDPINGRDPVESVNISEALIFQRIRIHSKLTLTQLNPGKQDRKKDF
jgi:hypothetical protein